MKKIKREALEKLKKAIIRYGFSMPFLVWDKEGQYYILDGHQRQKALLELSKEGYNVPKVPVIRVEAKSEKEAVEKLAHIGIQYGTLYKAGLEQLFEKYDIKADKIIETLNLELTKIDMDKPEIVITPDLFEENNYVVLKFDNKLDWQVAVDKLGIKRVKTRDSKDRYMRVGVGRVVNGTKAMAVLEGKDVQDIYTE